MVEGRGLRECARNVRADHANRVLGAARAHRRRRGGTDSDPSAPQACPRREHLSSPLDIRPMPIRGTIPRVGGIVAHPAVGIAHLARAVAGRGTRRRLALSLAADDSNLALATHAARLGQARDRKERLAGDGHARRVVDTHARGRDLVFPTAAMHQTPAAPPSARGSCAPSSVPFGCSTTAPA